MNFIPIEYDFHPEFHTMQTAWKLEPVHYFVEHSTPNESTELPSIVSAPIVPNSSVSSPTDEPIVSEHTPVNSLNADGTSSAPQSQQQPGESTSPCLPFLENKWVQHIIWRA